MAEVLARGILNLRRAARWLIEREEWDASEEAVVSALRRYAGSSRGERLAAARAALAQGVAGARSRLALITLARTGSVHRRLRRLPDIVGPDGVFALLLGETRLRLLVDEGDLGEVVGAVGREEVEGVDRDLAVVVLSFPDVDRPEDVHGAATLVLSALGQRGVTVLEVFSCLSDFSLVVEAEDSALAYDVVSRLTRVA